MAHGLGACPMTVMATETLLLRLFCLASLKALAAFVLKIITFSFAALQELLQYVARGCLRSGSF
jgi:hypothetical protein